MFESRAPRSRLPHALAVLYTLSIVVASLEPFGEWMLPVEGTPFWLFAPFPPRWTRFDVAANFIAYVPLGLFVSLVPRRTAPLRRLGLALAAGAMLSLLMETLQWMLPTRDASVIDLMANTAGAAFGGLIGVALARHEGARTSLAGLRNSLFLQGPIGDIGIALLVVWVVAQLNPGIPLFAVTYDPDEARSAVASVVTTDGAALLIEAAESAFQVLGVGLFLALLLRERSYVGGAVLLLIGAVLMMKGLAATMLLRPAVWEGWLRPGVSTGVAGGAFLLLVAIALPRPAMIAVCAIALLSSVLIPLLAPDLIFARAPLTLFNWRYGHLLNFNGLTRSVLLLWPVAAAAWLFALSGKPDWGRAH